MLGRVRCEEKRHASEQCSSLEKPSLPTWSLTWSYNLVALPLPHPLSLSPTRASWGYLPRTTCSLSQGLLLEETKLNKAPLKPQPWGHWPFLQGQEDGQGGVAMRRLLFLAAINKAEVRSPQKGMFGGSNRIKPCHPLPEQLGRTEFQNGRNRKGQA